MGPEKAPGPLAALGALLRRALPTSLSRIICQLDEVEEVAFFQGLVMEYLPEVRERILGEGSVDEMMAAFAQTFGERYFPLDHLAGGRGEGLADLTNIIPVHFQGLEYDDYDQLTDWPLPTILASLLVGFEGEVVDLGEGIRVTLLEAAAQTVPRELLDRIPAGGYPRDFLEEKLAGTAYQGLIVHARILCHDTGSFFFDVSCGEGWGDPPEWDPETVRILTEHWQHFTALQEEVDAFFKWMEEDPRARLAEVLNFLEGRSVDATDPRQLELPLGAA